MTGNSEKDYGLTEEELKLAKFIAKLSLSPSYFIKVTWGLIPQPPKPEYKEKVEKLTATTWDEWEEAKKLFSPDWFVDFKKGKHVTWQQWLILMSVEKAIKKEASNKITIVSGHGVGKSSLVSWLILWFLFCFYDSQVPCTAPASDQLYDVLWKELMKWIQKMPEDMRKHYKWESKHVRMNTSPETWFARAKTASKESPEALAGVHADNVLMAVDEASGVPEAIFETAQGALTNENILVILISNGTKDIGFFHDTHHRLPGWQRLSLNSEESPIVDNDFMVNMKETYGEDSIEYRIRVKGGFPSEGVMDDKGWVPLISSNKMCVTHEELKLDQFRGYPVLGIDPAGEGKDRTVFVLRDFHHAQVIFEEDNSDSKSIANKIITLQEIIPNLIWENIVVDAFGIGGDIGKYVALGTRGQGEVMTVNVGDKPDKPFDEIYLNLRAQYYHYGLRNWLIQGGEILHHKSMERQLELIKFMRYGRGLIKIMAKPAMKKEMRMSPDHTDALMLTFAREIDLLDFQTVMDEMSTGDNDFDPYSMF